MATTADESLTQASATTTDIGAVTDTSGEEVRSQAPATPAAPVGQRERMRLAETRPRRTKVVVRRVGIWSVFKFSMIFSACAMLVLWLSLLMIFLVLQAGGVMARISDLLGKLTTNTEGTKGYTPVPIEGGKIFTYLFIGLAVLAVIWAVITTFVALMYNLISDLIGGVEITLAERRTR